MYAIRSYYEQFFEHLDSLTVLELADYIKEFEERYGVSAAAAMPMAVPGAVAVQGEAQAEEEKTEFSVIRITSYNVCYTKLLR